MTGTKKESKFRRIGIDPPWPLSTGINIYISIHHSIRSCGSPFAMLRRDFSLSRDGHSLPRLELHFDLIYLNAGLYISLITISCNILHELFILLLTDYTLDFICGFV